MSKSKEASISSDEANNQSSFIVNSNTAGNTMYLYEDGVRYTYYCVEGDCNALYNSYEANDGNHIPTTNPYTFENNVLTVDLHFGNELVTPVAFECDGGEAHFETPEYSLFRLNSDCN